MPIPVQPGDILTMAPENNPLGTQTFDASELLEIIGQRLGAIPPEWLTVGIEARCLSVSTGTGWQTGRVRLSLQFDPEPVPAPTPAISTTPTPPALV